MTKSVAKRWAALAAGMAAFGALLPTAALPQPASSPPFTADFYRVRLQQVGYGRVERVVLLHRLQRDAANGPRWLVERRERRSDATVALQASYDWIDSQACDAVNVALRRLDALPPLTVRGPASLAGPPHIPPFHHPRITFEASPVNLGGSAVQISIEDTTGPLAIWWLQTEEALEPCWRHGSPTLDGTQVAPHLPEIEAWRD